jgi:hypothetical protein
MTVLKFKKPSSPVVEIPANDTGSQYNLEDADEFAAWCQHYPKAAKLLGSIIRSWKLSHAKLKGDKHTWTAYPLSDWCKWSGLKLRTLKWYLTHLEDAGLIRRKRAPFNGNIIHTFIRPTRLALLHSKEKKSAKTAGVPDYVETWQAAMLANEHAAYCKLTKTERSQLQEAIESMPPEHIVGIIEYALADWAGCTSEIADYAAEFNLPDKPTTAFFRKHVGIFINLYLTSEQGNP